MIIPVQHKCAEVILIPELLPAGSRLRDLAYYMEDATDENGNSRIIDVISSTESVKVGNYGSTEINTKDVDEMYRNLDSAVKHELSFENYRL